MPELEAPPIFARNLVIARKLAGMSQTQVARLVGVPRSYISDWETGKHEPRRGSWERLETVLEQPRWWFYKDHSSDGELPAA